MAPVYRWTSGVSLASTCWPPRLWTSVSHRKVRSQHWLTLNTFWSQRKRTNWLNWGTSTTSMRLSCLRTSRYGVYVNRMMGYSITVRSKTDRELSTCRPASWRLWSGWRMFRRCLRSGTSAWRDCRPNRRDLSSLLPHGLNPLPNGPRWRTPPGRQGANSVSHMSPWAPSSSPRACYVTQSQTTDKVIYAMWSKFISALARRTSDNSNSGKQLAESDPNKKKNIRKAKGGIKVQYPPLIPLWNVTGSISKKSSYLKMKNVSGPEFQYQPLLRESIHQSRWWGQSYSNTLFPWLLCTRTAHSLCSQSSLSALLYGFPNMLKTFLWDSHPCWHDWFSSCRFMVFMPQSKWLRSHLSPCLM